MADKSLTEVKSGVECAAYESDSHPELHGQKGQDSRGHLALRDLCLRSTRIRKDIRGVRIASP